MRHKHYDMIVAWAEGKTVQNFNDIYNQWEDVNGAPFWIDSFQYRIKPEPKPDWCKRILVQTFGENICRWDISHYPNANLKLTFDGETGRLKSAEVL